MIGLSRCPSASYIQGGMSMESKQDELDALKKFLANFETEGGFMTLRRSGKDVTAEQAKIVKAQISQLEAVLARLREGI